MQEWPVIYPDALYMMLSEQINKVGPGNGYVNRVLSAFGERSYEVRLVEGKLNLVMAAHWDYLDSNVSTPNVNELRKLVVDMKIRQVFSESDNKKMTLSVHVDLRRWINLANGILHAHILSYVGHRDSTPVSVNQIKREAILILKTHYPRVSLEHLLLAADVGETPEGAEEFISWMTHLETGRRDMRCPIPDNLC